MQPEGYNNGSNKVCLLNKALYGLKQAAREFYNFLAKLLNKLGYSPLKADESVFINKTTGIIIAAHIDDLLIFSNNIIEIEKLKNNIKKEVEISDLGNTQYYLGIEITRNRQNKELFLTQTKYIKELLYKFNITGDKPVYNPCI